MRTIKYRFWDGKEMYDWSWAQEYQWEVYFNVDKGIWRSRRGAGDQPLAGMNNSHEVIGDVYQNSELLK